MPDQDLIDLLAVVLAGLTPERRRHHLARMGGEMSEAVMARIERTVAEAEEMRDREGTARGR